MNLQIDAAVVILYHPTQSALDNIATYINNVKSLYVIDNSTTENSFLNQLSTFNNVKILHQGSNIGVAKGLNMALEKAYIENYTWMMTFDQDTSYQDKDIDMFMESLIALKDEKIVIVSPLHNKKFIIDNNENSFVEKDYVMTSANAVNVPMAREVGGYDENLFIDEVDHEFCFRLKENGYSILQNNSIAVNHSLGTSYKYNAKIKLYDPVRLYYMARNYLYLKRKYYTKFYSFFKTRDRYLFKFFLNQIIYGEQRLENIKMIFKGVKDYKNQKYGQFIDE